MKENCTLKDIAKELGVSVSTVSRSINGKSVVNEKTRQRVLEASKKYLYVPNEVARSLQKSSTQTIAVVLPDISENFFGTIVKSIENVVSRAGYMIILADSHENPEKERKYLDMLQKRRVDAVVLATVDCSGETAEPFIESDVPVVFIDNIPSLNNIDSITVDNCKAVEMGVDHLVSNGHKRIATIIGSTEETTGVERLRGYEQALINNGLELDKRLIEYGDYKQLSGYEAMKRLINNKDKAPFSAVIVTSEKMTYGALTAIKECSLNVPEDISVVGFDIHNLSGVQEITITSVYQPEEIIGQKVGELLLDRLNKKSDLPAPNTNLNLEPLMIYGDTVKKLK